LDLVELIKTWQLKMHCRSGKYDTGKIAEVENAGVSPMDSQPENKLRQW